MSVIITFAPALVTAILAYAPFVTAAARELS